MRQICGLCKCNYDDEFRLTACPHPLFMGNDGHNHFSFDHGSLIYPPVNDNNDIKDNVKIVITIYIPTNQPKDDINAQASIPIPDPGHSDSSGNFSQRGVEPLLHSVEQPVPDYVNEYFDEYFRGCVVDLNDVNGTNVINDGAGDEHNSGRDYHN